MARLAGAIAQYESLNGRFPPAALIGKEGGRLLSWRVLLLPQLGERALFERFHLDEPWDSDHNRALIRFMPSVFRDPAPSSQDAPFTTCYQVFDGRGAAFETPRELSLKKDFDLSKGDIIVLAEADTPVIWTKPQDMAYDPDGPLPTLRLRCDLRYFTARLSGAVMAFPADAIENELRKLIPRQ
jgi:hypothetical protein